MRNRMSSIDADGHVVEQPAYHVLSPTDIQDANQRLRIAL
jgi:hypothetical protein